MILKFPSLLSASSKERIDEVIEFLLHLPPDGLTVSEATNLIVQLPNLLSYDVKGHLTPQCVVLSSLLPENDTGNHLKSLILTAPHVLCPSIDTAVLHFIRRRVPRRQIGKLLRLSHPNDFNQTIPLRSTCPASLSSILVDGKPKDDPPGTDIYPL